MRCACKIGLLVFFSLFLCQISTAQVSVFATPSTVHVQPGSQVQFLASVSGTSNSVVIWTLAGTTCSGNGCGHIDSSGLYTAPATAPASNVVTVIATSLADLSASASASAIIGQTSDVTVTVSPAHSTVLVGQQQLFVAYVTGTTLTDVTWSLQGPACSSSSCGRLTRSGNYTAPLTVPSPAQITVVATSVADPTVSGSASLTVAAPLTVTVAPASVSLNAGLQQQFTASVTGTSNTAVAWSLAGPGCSGTGCGTISSNGLYTAPATPPSPPQVSVTATSAADTSKSGTAAVVVLPQISVGISPQAVQLLAGAQQQFTASVSGNANTAVSWTLSGSGCSGVTCGTITTGGLYTAPSVIPNPAQVHVTATSQADPTKSNTATVTIAPPVAVSISPTSVQLLTNQTQQFTATVTGSANIAVNWSVNGAGCNAVVCGTISSSGLYTAPATQPSTPQIYVAATSAADPTKSGTAAVTITGPVAINIAPLTAQIIVGGSQQFSATVSGTSNTGVAWSVSGTGCAGASCGTISASGLYVAPPTVPTPAQVSVTATSVADPAKSNSAAVTILPPIGLTLSPSAATVPVGSTHQFTATVTGSSNNGVLWSVSGNGCSGVACGTISSTGLYTAPASVPTPAQVTVSAAAAIQPSIIRTATVTIVPVVGVSIAPSTVTVVAGTFQTFTAMVTGTTDQSVVWSVSGGGCAGLACGTITSTGLYGAPGNVPSPATVTITATSVVDPTKSGTATVTLVPPVAVSISPANTPVVTGQQLQFLATVTGTTNTQVNWSINGAGCSGAACGTILPTGLYTAPSAIPSPPKISIIATSAADPTKSATAMVTIIAPITITISPRSADVAVNGKQQFQASIVGITGTSVVWSVSGAGCSGSSCGTIDASGLFTAPAIIPAGVVVVTAASQIDPSQSASASVTIIPEQNGMLNGSYAFYISGMNASGAYQAAGAFSADGNGNITSGIEDVNRASGVATGIALTGTYQVNAGGRGVLKLSSSAGSQTLRFALFHAGASGRVMTFDTTGTRASGIFERQDPTAFILSALKGGYVASLAGVDNTENRLGALSILYFNGNGGIPAGMMDANDAGTVIPTLAIVGGVYRVDKTGRGTVSFSIPGFYGGSFQFVIYIVSATKLIVLSTNPLSANNPLFGGIAQQQSGAPFAASYFNGDTIFTLDGVTGNSSYGAAGRITFDGVDQPYLSFDENNGGAVSSGKVLTGAYGVTLNGTGTLNLDNSNGESRVWAIYAIGPNHAYIMDLSSAAVGMGELKPQIPEAFFSNSDALGTYSVGTESPLLPEAFALTAEVAFDGQQSVSGDEDSGIAATLNADQLIQGSYSLPTSSIDGRGVITLTSGQPSNMTFWVVNPSEMVGLGLDPATKQPVILHFAQ